MAGGVPGGVGFRPLGRILVVRWDQGQSDFEERKICVDLSAGQSWVPFFVLSLQSRIKTWGLL